ncbi:efflux RND transporter periplasmic adaptor subunit [Kiritimatiellota bacterium B12222]|nr:efflux RND transporter periplasmic adaptor subunit [Kiritimatiellota bacterium B12222]
MSDSDQALWLEKVSGLIDYTGKPARFWEKLCETSMEVAGGLSSTAYVDAQGKGAWQCVGVWPLEPATARQAALHDCAPAIAKDCSHEVDGCLFRPLSGDPERCVIAVSLPLPGGHARIVLGVVVPPPGSDAEKAKIQDRLRAVVAAAPAYQVQHALQRARSDVGHFSNVLDLMTMLNGQDKFIGASMLLVNELSSRVRSDRVSLGWLEKEYIRVKVVSHMENFSKHMEGVQELEAAMEESFEQDAEVMWPVAQDEPDAPLISRDHQKFSESQTAGHVVSVPIRDGDKPIAVFTLERKSEPYTEQELRWLRLCADQVGPRLIQLEASDVWWGKRLARKSLKTASSLVGVEHTGWKILGILGVLLVGFLFFGRWPYRLRGDFELRSEMVRVLPAPFNGFIDEAVVNKGQLVVEGELLLQMDIRELLIEKASAIADVSRYTREMEKARATRELADMQMAGAMAEQAVARLELVNDRLSRASLVAPFSGAVVDGDLRDRSGAPVRQGDVLFRVAQWDAMRVSADVDESDIDFLKVGAEARLIFASRPEAPVKARVISIEPMAQTRESKNVFVAHLEIEAEEEPWWRPGMSGNVRVDAGKKPPYWILTRRTLDYFRLRWGW